MTDRKKMVETISSVVPKMFKKFTDYIESEEGKKAIEDDTSGEDKIVKSVICDGGFSVSVTVEVKPYSQPYSHYYTSGNFISS